jgi:hypothetical protein
MKLPPAARRSLALVATTALLTSGATGVFVGTAHAAGAGSAVTAVTPSATNNSGKTAVTVTGSGFAASPAPADTISFSLEAPSAYGTSTPPLTGKPAANSVNTSTSYSFTLDTTNAPPGKYDVYDGDGAKCKACFLIGSSGAPDVSLVSPGADTSDPTNGQLTNLRGPNAVDIFGSHLAKASFVNLTLPNGQPDKDANGVVHAGLIVGDPNNPGDYSGYESASVIRAEYSESAGFTPGKHLVTVTNTAAETGASGELWLPFFTAAGVSPSTFGAGGNPRVLTVTGAGIRQGSHISIPNGLDCRNPANDPCPDVAVGQSTVSADGTTISAPVSFTTNAATGPRSLTIVGPDGGHYSVGSAITVTPKPVITAVSPNKLGQGASVTVSITGTGFAVGATNATVPTFSVSGSGVTAKTLSSTNVGASVSLTVAPDAPAGGRTITVTNPDGGSSTFSGTQSTPALTIDLGPTITSVSPVSAAVGTTRTITVLGANYDAPPDQGPTAKPTIQISLPPAAGATRQPDSSLSVSNVTVTPANGVTQLQDKVTFDVSVSSTAPAGLRDILLTNPSDQGAVLCAGCFGIDNLTVAPTSGSNTGTKQIAMTGAGVVAGSTAKLVRAGDPTIQPAIPGNSTTVSGTTLTAIFDLTDAAPGPYNAIVTAPDGTVSACSSCFTVTGSTPSITSITPAAGGQGAVNLPITVNGNNFSRGEQLTITDVLVHDIVWVSRTKLTAKIDIANNAPTGAKDAKATNADGVASGTKTGAFTVNAPPSPTASSPASYGQGAKGVKITVTGSGFQNGATVSFGSGVTVTGVVFTASNGLPGPLATPDKLEATVTIGENAAAVQRDVVVTNPDGGVGTLVNGFAVNFGPKVTGITPAFLAPNASNKAVTIAGSNFSTTAGKTAVPTVAGVTFSNVVVAADGNSINANASVNSGTAKGLKDVVVTNPTDSGVGTCTGCLAIATPPAPPTGVGIVTTTSSSITAKWTAPADNGGAPITSYVVSARDAAGKAAGTSGTTSGSATSGTVTGLKPSTSYQVLVIARNVAGDSTPGTAGATTTGNATSRTTLLTTAHSPSLTTTGQHMTLSGRLLQVTTGTGIAGATIELALVPDIGTATFPKVVTNSTGNWSYGFNPVYSHTIKTIYRGDANYDASQAPSYRMGVSTRVTVTSPANGSRSSVSSPLVIRGLTSPNKSGSLITLYRWNGSTWAAVQNRTVASNGSYGFSYNFGRGAWTLKVGIGRTTGNFVGYSPAFGVYRV